MDINSGVKFKGAGLVRKQARDLMMREVYCLPLIFSMAGCLLKSAKFAHKKSA
jgi:hypothetical protein